MTLLTPMSLESKGFHSVTTPNPLTKKEVSIRLNDSISDVIRSIAADYQKRLNYNANPSLLQRGIFYAQDYYKALKETNQSERLQHLYQRDSFYNGFLNAKHFKLAEDKGSPSGKMVLNFILKEGVDPVEALLCIRKNLSLLGCGEVCQVAQYEAVLDIIGPEKFRAIFFADSTTPLMIGSKLNNNPIARLRTYFLQENPQMETIRKGDQVYFYNIGSYADKHLNGPCSGYNVICVDDTSEDPKFTTLGLPPAGLTKAEIEETLISDYNRPFDGFDYLTEKTKKAFFEKMELQGIASTQLNAQAQISPQEFEEMGGGKTKLLCELDAGKITQLANCSLEKVRILFDSYRAIRGTRKFTNG